MRVGRKVRVEYEVANGWSRWVQPVMANYIMVCCDCGLAHRMKFRVMKVTKVRKDGTKESVKVRGHIVQFKAKRAPRYTSVQRRKA